MPKNAPPRPNISPLVALIDVAIVIIFSFIAHWLRYSTFDLDVKFKTLSAGIALLQLICSTYLGVYDSWRGKSLPSILKRYSTSLLCVAALLTTFLVFTKTAEMFSRIWLGLLLLLIWFSGITYRSIHFWIFRKIRRSGANLRKILLISTPETNLFSAEALKEYGYEITSTISSTDMEELINEEHLSGLIDKLNINEIWINLPLNLGSFLKDIVYALRHETVDIRYIPDFEDIQLLNHKASNIAGMYTIDISCTPLDGLNRFIKRAEDIFLASLIIILVSPLCLLIAMLIKLDSPGPVIFKQYRSGQNGRKMKIYKFRTMDLHTEKENQVTQAILNDPRLTKVGAFLRRTSLDELPQFINVLQGRMSIVGPRPHALAHDKYYKDLVESYMWRHKVKPGITGLSQIRGLRGLTDTIKKMEARVECDLEYINNWSLWFDIKIIFLTIFYGFKNNNAF